MHTIDKIQTFPFEYSARLFSAHAHIVIDRILHISIWQLRVSFGKSETVGSEKKYTVFSLEHDFFLCSIDFCTILLTGSDSRPGRNNSGQGFEKNYFFQFCHFFSPLSKNIFRKLLIIFYDPFPGTPTYILKIFFKFNIFMIVIEIWSKIHGLKSQNNDNFQ